MAATGKIKMLLAIHQNKILTVASAAGVILTAAAASKASYDAGKDDQNKNYFGEPTPHTPLEFVKTHGKNYIPTLLLGGATVGTILVNDKIYSNRIAALAGAYMFSEKKLDKYRDEVKKMLGDSKEKTVNDKADIEVAKEVDWSNPPTLTDDDVLCLDNFSGRYFSSTAEKIRRAENTVLTLIRENEYACLGDFYGQLDLPPAALDDELGWTQAHPISVSFTSDLLNMNKPVLIVNFGSSDPIHNYHRFN